MRLFFLQNAIICVLFMLAFFAGGIVNAIYASENRDLHLDLCFGFNSVGDDEFCHQLGLAFAGEAASAVS